MRYIVRNQTMFRLLCIACTLVFWAGTFLVWRAAPAAANPHFVDEMLEEMASIPAPSPSAATEPGEIEPVIEEPVSSVPVVTPEPDTMPATVSLSVPFTSQAPEKNWDQPWQDACEEAAALMLDAFYKDYGVSPLFAKDEILKLVAWEEARGWERSISAEKIQTLLTDYFGIKNVRLVENPTIEGIKKFLAAGKPVYVVADGKTLPNPHFRSGGPVYHALIIRGYTDDAFITNDPGTRLGENFSYKYNDLMNAIRDWNNGDVKNGRKVILVIDGS